VTLPPREYFPGKQDTQPKDECLAPFVTKPDYLPDGQLISVQLIAFPTPDYLPFSQAIHPLVLLLKSILAAILPDRQLLGEQNVALPPKD
jgi:hypothetical protein